MILSEKHIAFLRKFADIAIRCLYPKHCPVCDEIIPLGHEYCHCSRECSRKIDTDFCRHCGYDNGNCICSGKNTVKLPNVTGVYIYNGKIRADILDLKFNNEKRKAVMLGECMAERCANVFYNIDFDIITFVPMTKDSYNKRGYNQSELLACQVGKMMFVSVENLFDKTRDTRTQHELNGYERLGNVKDSVVLKPCKDVLGKNILICDDVKTTGATLDQCVQALKNAGANEICCICVALADFSV